MRDWFPPRGPNAESYSQNFMNSPGRDPPALRRLQDRGEKACQNIRLEPPSRFNRDSGSRPKRSERVRSVADVDQPPARSPGGRNQSALVAAAISVVVVRGAASEKEARAAEVTKAAM